MRDVDPLEILVLDELADTHDEVTHEVDGGDVHRRKISVAVGHEELVHLVLALELRPELLGRDVLRVALLDLLVSCVHI